MTIIKRYPKDIEIRGQSVDVRVQFMKDENGLEHVIVAVASRALPDERQVGFKAVKYADGYVVSAWQKQKLPKTRAPDLMPADRKIDSTDDLSNEYGVLVQKFFKGSVAERVIKMTGGFGCQPTGVGRKLFGEYVHDGRDFAGRREDVSRYATQEEIDAAQALKAARGKG